MTSPSAAGPPALASPIAAAAALIATGSMVGVAVPLTRLGLDAGAESLPWALVTTTGAAIILQASARLNGLGVPVRRAHLVYYAAIGLFSIALPGLILAFVVPRIGAGMAGVGYTLPPILTLALSAAIGLERPDARRALGIALGLAGALMIVLPRGNLPAGVHPGWMVLALGLPLSVAIGNVVRARLWPAGAHPLANAAGAMTAGAGLLLVAALVTGEVARIASAAPAAGIAVLHALASAAGFLLFFVLQRIAGPVYTSQVGYVATAVALAAAALVFGEPIALAVYAAVAVIAAGVVLVSLSGHPRR